MSAYAIGVDLGGSHLAVGLVDPLGKTLELKEVKIDNLAPPEITLEITAKTIQEVWKNRSEVCGVGMGLPGNHDHVRGICHFSPNFPSWHEVEVTPYLSRVLKLPVYMLNDVRVATLGEFHFGAGKKVKNLVMMAIGTGIGGGIIINGQLLIGAQEAAGEIGHMTIITNGPLCNCGNRGCLEALASGPAISSRGAEAILRGQSAKLRDKIKSLDELNAKVIADLAALGDDACKRILEEAGEAIGIGIASLAVTLNPELFIVGGGVAQTGKPLFAAIQAGLNKHVHIFPSSSVSIVPASLGVRAGLVGAAAYAFIQCGVAIP